MIKEAVNEWEPLPTVEGTRFSSWRALWSGLQRRLCYLGPAKLIYQLPVSRAAAVRILEVGCREGALLLQFAEHFPNAHLVGLEHSERRAARARQNTEPYQNRIDVYASDYTSTTFAVRSSFDVVLLAYELSLTKHAWEARLQQAYRDLKPGGLLAVVDFHRTAWSPLQRKHVFEPELLAQLQVQFAPLSVDVCRAYGGLWQYFFFMGMKPQP